MDKNYQPTTTGKKPQRRKTAKREKKPYIASQLVRTLLEMLMTVKLYHWRTTSYAQHKATDELYENLNKNIDTFVEVFLGKDESRIEHIDATLPLYNFDAEGNFKKRVYEYRRFLQDMSKTFKPDRDSDLLTIRDELLININQFLYLMTLY